MRQRISSASGVGENGLLGRTAMGTTRGIASHAFSIGARGMSDRDRLNKSKKGKKGKKAGGKPQKTKGEKTVGKKSKWFKK